MFSLFDALLEDPLWFLEFSLYRVPSVLIALVLHEWAHGYVAYRLGDPTAKQMGRLTLNPLRHLDPIGTFMMIFFGFGWAKPVPINPGYFRNPHRDDFLVSIAGIVMNLTLFLVFTVAAALLNEVLWDPRVLQNYSLHELLGIRDGVINIILGGGGGDLIDYFANPGVLWAVRLTSQIAMINLYIAIFNLLPIPPLDGSHLVNDLIFKGKLFVDAHVARIGMAAVLVLSFTGMLGKVMGFLADGAQSGVLSVISAIMGG